MIWSGILYFLLFSYSLFISNKKNILIFLFILLCLSGFRYGIGTDYHGYVSHLSYMSSNFFESIQYLSIFEPLYFLLLYFSALISKNGPLFIFTLSFISLIPIYILSQRINEKIVYIFLFLFATLYFGASMNLVRQMIAVNFSLVAFYSLNSNRLREFFVYICIACGFHIVSFLMFGIGLLYIFINKRMYKNQKIMNTLYLICIVTILFITVFFVDIISIPVISDLFTYLKIDNVSINFGTILLNLPFIIIFVYYFKQNKITKFFLILYFFGLILTLFADLLPIVSRAYYFFDIFKLILLVELYDSILDFVTPTNIKKIVAIYGYVIFTYIYIFNNGGNIAIYRSIFFKN